MSVWWPIKFGVTSTLAAASLLIASHFSSVSEYSLAWLSLAAVTFAVSTGALFYWFNKK